MRRAGTGSSPRLRIGTRGSALARWQAEHVAALVAALPGAPPTTLVLVKTAGDRIRDVPLSQVEGKSFFTKEIEEALLEGRVDLAVHSLKDLATALPDGLSLEAVLAREDPRDVWVVREGVDPANLPTGARVGTSSLRRRAFLARWRRDLVLEELRGNVPTRLRKLDEGRFEAVVLAAAGLRRLGLEDRIAAYLPLEVMLPAVSQGAVAVQTREDDGEVGRWVRPLDHPPTRAATAAERALLASLEGGCQVPVGALARVVEGGGEGEGEIHLRAVVCAPDGSRWVEGEGRGPVEKAEEVGRGLAEDLLARGGREILQRIRGGGGGG